MIVKSRNEAWNEANKLMPCDYELDSASSEKAGYNIFRGNTEYYAYICDLGNRLEVNLPNGKSVNIVIEEKKEEDKIVGKASSFYMYNVVCYDGCDAYVHKFILKPSEVKKRIKEIESIYSVTVLLTDKLYDVNLDNIVALKECDDLELKLSYERFIDMYIFG